MSIYLFPQAEVMDLVQLMGGRVYLDLNVSVNHLIAGEVGSKKYFVAASLGKPILLPSWVKACWEKSQDRCVLSLHSVLFTLRRHLIFVMFSWLRILFLSVKFDYSINCNSFLIPIL